MKKLLLTLAALAMTSPALANVICAGCEYRDNFAGTFLGVFDSLGRDLATFQNSDVGNDNFADLWVFDVSPNALGSMSADWTLLASIGNFVGQLYRDDGSQCAGNQCQSVNLGALVAQAVGDPSRWEIIDFLPAGRYVLRISGQPNPLNNGAYTGQMGFLAVSIREAGTLGLLGLGLAALGFAVRRHQR